MKTIRVRGSDEEIPVGKILCLVRNYSKHAEEMQSEIPEHPVVFFKPATALIREGGDIIIPPISREVHHEVELVVAIAKEGKQIAESNAGEFILGYAVGLDMTLRDVQNEAKKKGLPWSVAKGFDTSAPVSEIIPASQVKSFPEMEMRCSVNGTLRQKIRAGSMVFSPEQIISYCSSLFTLERGDLIFTGTPEGVGKVQPGDTIEAELVNFTKINHRVMSALLT